MRDFDPSIFFGLFFCLIPLLSLGLFAFWIWALVDCLSNEPSHGNEKLIWILVIVLLHGLGGLIYCFVRRPQRIREHGR